MAWHKFWKYKKKKKKTLHVCVLKVREKYDPHWSILALRHPAHTAVELGALNIRSPMWHPTKVSFVFLRSISILLCQLHFMISNINFQNIISKSSGKIGPLCVASCPPQLRENDFKCACYKKDINYVCLKGLLNVDNIYYYFNNFFFFFFFLMNTVGII
jgi:hypothetical protein